MLRPILLSLSALSLAGVGAALALEPASADAPRLYLSLGVHIEPYGLGDPQMGGGGDYNTPRFFAQHVSALKELIAVVEAHGGRLVIQSQSPFSQQLVTRENPLLRDAAAAGHEVGLHLHADAHLGRGAEALPAADWTAKVGAEIALIEAASGAPVTYMSGGARYPGILDVAEATGIRALGDYKDRTRQEADPAVLRTTPWRPAGGPAAEGAGAFAAHDPAGAVIFVPAGVVDLAIAKHAIPANSPDFNALWLAAIADALTRSLAVARPDHVDAFHFTVHPQELRGPPDGAPFAALDAWLTTEVDPLVASGDLAWATFAQVAAAYAGE